MSDSGCDCIRITHGKISSTFLPMWSNIHWINGEKGPWAMYPYGHKHGLPRLMYGGHLTSDMANVVSPILSESLGHLSELLTLILCDFVGESECCYYKVYNVYNDNENLGQRLYIKIPVLSFVNEPRYAFAYYDKQWYKLWKLKCTATYVESYNKLGLTKVKHCENEVISPFCKFHRIESCVQQVNRGCCDCSDCITSARLEPRKYMCSLTYLAKKLQII